MARSISTDGEAFNLTPSDTVDYGVKGLTSVYVGNTGNVTIETMNGTTVLYENIPAGSRVLRACRKVLATGTTATGLVGEY